MGVRAGALKIVRGLGELAWACAGVIRWPHNPRRSVSRVYDSMREEKGTEHGTLRTRIAQFFDASGRRHPAPPSEKEETEEP